MSQNRNQIIYITETKPNELQSKSRGEQQIEELKMKISGKN